MNNTEPNNPDTQQYDRTTLVRSENFKKLFLHILQEAGKHNPELTHLLEHPFSLVSLGAGTAPEIQSFTSIPNLHELAIEGDESVFLPDTLDLTIPPNVRDQYIYTIGDCQNSSSYEVPKSWPKPFSIVLARSPNLHTGNWKPIFAEAAKHVEEDHLVIIITDSQDYYTRTKEQLESIDIVTTFPNTSKTSDYGEQLVILGRFKQNDNT